MKNINIKMVLSEYKAYTAKATGKNHKINWNKLANLLCTDGEWTRQSAEILVEIVQNYGSFILKNAFALALATNIEDGKLGL